MDSRRMRQIYQTVSWDIKHGEDGPPASYTEEEKEYYIKTKEGILEDRKNGFTGTYSFPNDYD